MAALSPGFTVQPTCVREADPRFRSAFSLSRDQPIISEMWSHYFVLLLCIFLLEILAGVLAYIYYQQLNQELKQSLKETMTTKYAQNGHDQVTKAVDKLQQEFKCCGSNGSSDWAESIFIRSGANGRLVPDSCCKTSTELCGLRDHPSNIYKVEGGCISKLEEFILDHLKIIGAVGVGIACVQIIGMVFTCCLYRNLKAEPY
ncbi:CD151 antigen [Takifugu flavidus]|uniref:CD151 antigen n=1 Tax=Takifugu flavidus TaxID=433684 RepID=A0A5C6NM21_9TELE|nr:CD151 antigen [Takifugu flavidus]